MLEIDSILQISSDAEFERCALEVFRFQARECEPYRRYVELLGVDVEAVQSVEDIPFLPVELFKSEAVYCGKGEPEKIFTSSNTGSTTPSRHMMQSLDVYRKTFTAAFEHFYGAVEGWSIYGLLPNYLEREGSSLVYMVDKLIERCGSGGFYLYDYEKLVADMASDPRPKILLGVSYALWDLAEKYAPQLGDTVVMETGGMKGRREEISKSALHDILCRG
ncbi:MAG: acyltransferase, partial [Alistipes sp.]|nr:acyltransferase [Alistipes sp.]